MFNNVDAGDGLAGMKQGDLIIWYVEQQNAQGAYSSTAEVKEEVKCIKAIIEVSSESLTLQFSIWRHALLISKPDCMGTKQSQSSIA